MKTKNRLDLDRLFSTIPELSEDEMFVGRVYRRIRLRRCARLALKALCALAVLAVVAGLMPVLTDLTYLIARGSDLFTNAVAAVALSPIGYLIGGGTGLVFFLRMRS
jgi:hypothetical protein